jgi:hypothetical protein
MIDEFPAQELPHTVSIALFMSLTVAPAYSNPSSQSTVAWEGIAKSDSPTVILNETISGHLFLLECVA